MSWFKQPLGLPISKPQMHEARRTRILRISLGTASQVFATRTSPAPAFVTSVRVTQGILHAVYHINLSAL